MQHTNFRHLRGILLASFMVLCLPVLTQVAPEKSEIIEILDGQEYYIHFVKEGETLYSLARTYGVNVNTLFLYNPSSREGIKPGDLIKIPVVRESESSAPEVRQALDTARFHYHIVSPGETLFGLSRRYLVAMDRIRQLNPVMGESLHIGEVLRIPRLDEPLIPPDKTGFISHTVKSGETLYGLARTYNVTTGEILNANPFLREGLKAGQDILIPGSGEAPEENQPPESQGQSTTLMHTVSNGETVYSIARSYGVPVDTLKSINPGLADAIHSGQQIRVKADPATGDFILHTSEEKQKVEKIAQLYQLETEELRAFNPDITRKVDRGQVIRIPVNRETTAPDSTAGEEQPAPGTGDTGVAEFPDTRDVIFNVALMVPLFLDEKDSILVEQISEEDLDDIKPFRFIQFYEGFLLAADSLARMGMKINLFVYDIDQETRKAEMVLGRSELQRMDLIIGPFYSGPFAKVAGFSRLYEIPIVNPLSFREEIIQDNPQVIKMKPSLESRTTMLADHIGRNHPASNILLVRHNNYQWAEEASHIKNQINRKIPAGIYIGNDRINRMFAVLNNHTSLYTENTLIRKQQIQRSLKDSTYFSNSVKEIIYTRDSLPGLKVSLSRLRDNIVIVLTDERVFAHQILSELNKTGKSYEITVFGLPDWQGFDNLEANHLMNLNFHFLRDYYLDYSSRQTLKFITAFRNRYHTEPIVSGYAFDGFDAGWFFLNALNRYGSRFPENLNDPDITPLSTKYHFRRITGGGLENTYWNLIHLKDFQEFNADDIPD
ncbi:MAG: LysM peptidoglycan-binding domain-containing protein [Bacteroidales bacterium]|nr:LysM peptidoglycan-binding domain-containing protein [Bacteroidales bacterium]